MWQRRTEYSPGRTDTGSLGGREVWWGRGGERVQRDGRGGAAGSQRNSLSESFAAERGREMGQGGQTDESALPRCAIAGAAGAHLSLPQFPHL